MHTLHNQACEACQNSSTALTDDEARTLLRQLPQWTIIDDHGVKKLQRIYCFADFAGALAFANRIAGLAEQENHHPALLTEWGKLTVSWWTHRISGLQRTDFILAARCDRLLPLD